MSNACKAAIKNVYTYFNKWFLINNSQENWKIGKN